MTILYSSTSTHSHSVSDVSEDSLKKVHFSRSSTNVVWRNGRRLTVVRVKMSTFHVAPSHVYLDSFHI